MNIEENINPVKLKLTGPEIIGLWIGKFAVAISIVLLIVIFFSYLIKPDYLAALTFFPPWMWGFFGIVVAIFIRLYKKYIPLITIACWIAFIVIFAEEPGSLLRGFFTSNINQQSNSTEKTVTVISLNCAGGNIEAAREVIPYHPDIVLLQEAPTRIEDTELVAHELFNGDSAIAYGPDCAIIIKGKLEQIQLPKPQNIFMTQARVRLNSGIQTDVLCVRLKPPVAEINLLSANCWIHHAKDRKLKRQQINQIIEQINPIPREIPVILGGDFNVGAYDGCLELLEPRLKDTFCEGGIGWGHTAINSIPLFRVDQIWASSHFKTISNTARKTVYSDHRMVICKLKIQ